MSLLSNAAYEYLARVIAYEDGHEGYSKGDPLDFTIDNAETGAAETWHFVVREIYEPTWYNGFEAILLEQVDEGGESLKQAVLACGGTDQLIDFLIDLEPIGIGYAEFYLNSSDVYEDLKELADEGCAVSLTGHSLGGALAQWFAVYAHSKGDVAEIDSLVTFNSPGITQTMPFKSTQIGTIRHYVNDGDLISMAGKFYVSNAADSSAVLFVNTARCSSGPLAYGASSQHSGTLFFLGALDDISRDPDLAVLAEGSPETFAEEGFSYLMVHCDENFLIGHPQLREVLAAVPDPAGGYWMFNKQYAEFILLLTISDPESANLFVDRKGTEEARTSKLLSLWQVALDALVTQAFRTDFGEVAVGEENLIASDGSANDAVIRGLSCSLTGPGPCALFDFTNGQFLDFSNQPADAQLTCGEKDSQLVVTAELEDGGGWMYFQTPAFDESARYSLVSIANGAGTELAAGNHYRAGDLRFVVDLRQGSYELVFSVDGSISREKATVLADLRLADEEVSSLAVYVTDIDAAGKNVSVTVGSAAAPEGVEFQLQETGAAGIFSAVIDAEDLPGAAPGEVFFISYLDGDDGTGAAVTVQKEVVVPSAEAPLLARAADDLDGDRRADVVMSIVEAGHGAEGATGAWLIQYDQTPVWGDLSQRNEGWEIFGIGATAPEKLTGDVYLKSTGNVVGAWVTNESGQVAGWETVCTFDADTQVLGLGDFNGDGQSDLLLRNVNGAVGCHLTDGTGWHYFQSLGDEWQIAATGDLNGDGRSDVVLKHDAGFAGSWLTQSDCTMVWADLDTLPENFGIVGCGDFDGDGTDDVLLRTGDYYGAWLVDNGSAASWFGLGDLGNITVEQIADFDADGTDDLRIRTSAGDLGAQLVKGEDTLEWHYYGSVGSEWSTRLAAI
ncbi:MAG: hypothetical protein IJS01_08415 [Lentisphaeria bacterium]|nr:hypothetical protein [Lentisphaeria bacterium]